jgi:hypothetical protein
MQWWLFWNYSNPHNFPLPSVLASLSELEETIYLSRGFLDPKVDKAAETVWESHQSDIEMMLYINQMRPMEQNSIQHPDPSTAAAYKFLKDLKSYSNMTEEQNTIIESVIKWGTRWSSSGEQILLFSRNATQASPGPSTGNIGRSITQQREEDDNDEGSIPVKKQRREE